MKISDFLSKLESEQPKIVHFCAIHMLEKKFDVQNDDLNENDLKEFFINYNNYEKLLNDYANVIYRQFESSNDEIYNSMCKYFNENGDNKYLFEHRLTRVMNQDPKKYLNIEDVEMRNAAIFRVQDKIDIIENSKYYKENKELANQHIKKLKDSLDLVKRAVGIA